jgi:hypothetical protein
MNGIWVRAPTGPMHLGLKAGPLCIRAVEEPHMGLTAVGYAVSRKVTSSQTKIWFAV